MNPEQESKSPDIGKGWEMPTNEELREASKQLYPNRSEKEERKEIDKIRKGFRGQQDESLRKELNYLTEGRDKSWENVHSLKIRALEEEIEKRRQNRK